MSEILIKRIDKEEEEVKRIAKATINKISDYKKELYTIIPDNIKSLILKEMFNVDRYITDYENQLYSMKNCPSLSDCIKKISFRELCNKINEKISFIERCITQKYNYNVAEDARLWIRKTQDRIKEFDGGFGSRKDLKSQIEELEVFIDKLYITEFITDNDNYDTVKEIYEYAQYFKCLDKINFLRRSDNLFLYIGTTVILKEFCSSLTVLDECEESLRNAILDYISDIQMLNNIVEMEKEN